ncbi:3'-5' exonuclease [Microbulbifer sp. MKSA007]|nr:3'-5' exonuclease [Microbulbifer sp. MKSA007]
MQKASQLTMKNQTCILLVDLECTCDNEPPLPPEEAETIELGAIVGSLTQKSFVQLDERQLYVKPFHHRKLTLFCTELTGITQEQVDKASLLPGVLDKFKDWLSNYELAAWGSWGNFDAWQLRMETGRKEIANPLQYLPHINVKQIFADNKGHRVNLAKAIKLSGLTFSGRLHSGIDDTRNIAQLLENDIALRTSFLNQI